MTETVFENLIAGQWVGAADFNENRSPSDVSDVIGLYARASVADVDRAVQAGKAALGMWAFYNPQARSELLERIGSMILERKAQLGRLLAREEGKTLPEAIGETVRAAQIFKFYAGEALRVTGDHVASIRPDIDVEIVREPVGVVGLITPWNFPIAIPAWKIAPALCYGNTIVLKPAELAPGCAHALVEIMHEAGVPAGVVNLVMGRGSVVGDAMLAHLDIDAISFTGSVPVGRGIAVEAAKGLKKVQLEMGGKNPMVIMEDADLDMAVDVCVNGAFFSTGQRCTASSRLIVQDSIHDAFVEKLVAATHALRVGNALDEQTQIGPVVSRSQLEGNLDYVALAAREGAEVIGGEQVNGETEGYYQRPALFLGANNQMRICREEIFGPCASVLRFGAFEEAVNLANDTAFGLSAGICTSSLKYARTFKRQVQAGMVMVNLPTAGVDYHVPFGGRKGSSYGSREQGRYAIEFYTTVKTGYTLAV